MVQRYKKLPKDRRKTIFFEKKSGKISVIRLKSVSLQPEIEENRIFTLLI